MLDPIQDIGHVTEFFYHKSSIRLWGQHQIPLCIENIFIKFESRQNHVLARKESNFIVVEFITLHP